MQKSLIVSAVCLFGAVSAVNAHLGASPVVDEQAQYTDLEMDVETLQLPEFERSAGSIAAQIHASLRGSKSFGQGCDLLKAQSGQMWSCRVGTVTTRGVPGDAAGHAVTSSAPPTE